MVPCLLLLRTEILPSQDAIWLAALPLIASAYGFCQKEAKTADHYFLGFPSYWNIIAFYLYVLKAAPWVNAFVIIFLSIMVFVPIKYIYPSRSPRFRALTNVLGCYLGCRSASHDLSTARPSADARICLSRLSGLLYVPVVWLVLNGRAR